MTGWNYAPGDIFLARDLAEGEGEAVAVAEEAEAVAKIGLSMREEFMNDMLVEQMPPVFNDHLYDTASYFKRVSSGGTHRIMMQQCLPSMKNLFGDDDFLIDLDEPDLRHAIALILSKLPSRIWDPFVKLDRQLFNMFVKAAADFVYIVYPKEIICSMTANELINVSNEQLDHLWEQLVHFGKLGPSFQDVCWFIAQLIRDTDKYSLVTETHVSSMLDTYSIQLEDNNFKLPYSSVGRPDLEKGPLFNKIFEVVQKMEFRTEIKESYYPSVLISIVKEEYKEWSLPLSKNDMLTINLREPQLLSPLEKLVDILINIVRGKMMMRLSVVVRPLKLLGFSVFDYFRVSPEISDLIKVAELHRLALGSRFIKRSNLMWAFHECGHSLPPGIMNHPEVNECHPPYHIYLAAMELAELFGDKLQLENFVYVVLCWNESKMVATQEEDYIVFLEALRHGNLEKSIDLGGPIFIKAQNILQDTSLEFNIGCNS